MPRDGQGHQADEVALADQCERRQRGIALADDRCHVDRHQRLDLELGSGQVVRDRPDDRVHLALTQQGQLTADGRAPSSSFRRRSMRSNALIAAAWSPRRGGGWLDPMWIQ
jgi:hypothetical protein